MRDEQQKKRAQILIETPTGCPFPQSESLKGIRFTGRFANYTDADTWYPSWAADNRMYSPFTDTIGNGVNGTMSRSDKRKKAVVGHAAISGDDPMNLVVSEEGVIPGPGKRYKGRYPSALFTLPRSLVCGHLWRS